MCVVDMRKAEPRTCLATRNTGGYDSIDGLNKPFLSLIENDFRSKGSAPTAGTIAENIMIITRGNKKVKK